MAISEEDARVYLHGYASQFMADLLDPEKTSLNRVSDAAFVSLTRATISPRPDATFGTIVYLLITDERGVYETVSDLISENLPTKEGVSVGVCHIRRFTAQHRRRMYNTP